MKDHTIQFKLTPVTKISSLKIQLNTSSLDEVNGRRKQIINKTYVTQKNT